MRFLAPIAVMSILAAPMAEARGPMDRANQALQQQGFTVMQTVRERHQYRVTAQRRNEVRELIYDARTGKLLWDNMDPNRDRARDHLFQQEFDRDHLRLQTRDPASH
ncbi:hypothetical protein GC209_01675 [bacterium]|nr:hypothetical protein [bacterium]